MRISRLSALLGAAALCAVLGAGVLTPTTARADEPDTLAAAPVADAAGLCGRAAPTFDDIVTSAATALRGVVPAAQVAAFDRQVDDFRHAIAAVRVHRDGLPVDPATLGGRVAQLDDPIVTYLVNGLDAVRTGRLDHTLSIGQLGVNDVIEVFILSTRIVKIPVQLAASLVPTAGFFLKFLVGGVFSGVKWLARRVQDAMRGTCTGPSVYGKLDLSETDFPSEHVAVPGPIADLARQLVLADGHCTPISDLTTATLVERTRDFLAHTDLPIDRGNLDATAAGLQDFLRDNRIAKLALLRKTDQLGPVVDYLDYGPITFLANLGFDIYEGKATDTVPLADITVENAYDLTTLALDVTSLLLTAANLAAGWTGVSNTILTPLGMAETLAFAPATYGAPILRGVMQSMCAV
ncbi:hypothetical protein IU500_29475 [Nocardia terpenica]|uniref:hypothetical protein n=1 Tax=Nocardia terpenica TaxID=455432 RepID=UPI001896396C|nr:hypothetical protein [Nocardia terpenica]MBF6065088.1 hypothetical protein [Nocardia terpenica]MBF6108145.1 hypothetical protein [Nocardia terpenica]MBF6115360.1 hypothetical protein [Nocardia terpenica]MBF6122682.1 hypothetical protein [Nocardia terpenica]